MENTTLKTAELDGKKIAYCSSTNFYIEIGKGKGSYKVKYHIVGNLAQAVMLYNGINIGNGYKARLSMNDQILARKFS